MFNVYISAMNIVHSTNMNMHLRHILAHVWGLYLAQSEAEIIYRL